MCLINHYMKEYYLEATSITLVIIDLLVLLTLVMGKLLEGIVKDHIMHYLTTSSLLSDYQYGFCQGTLCLSQLLRIVDIWTKCLGNKQEIDIIYLDLQKAFDKFPINVY